jgi:hypothetical protein
MRIARHGEADAPIENDELVDSEVPAAVLCAHCGDADCSGCFEELTRSGVVAVVAWERPGIPTLTRLWATARATTLDAERFFESLPDGPVAPALRFAVASEMIAASAMTLAGLLALAVIAPGWARQVLAHEMSAVLRYAVAGIPCLSGLLVAAHIAHALALDRGARRAGARGATRRALRFGLYAAGWDLVIGPLGVLILAVKEGGRAALSISGFGMGLPGRSARAFLRGCYGLEGDSAAPALRASYVAAAASTALGAIAVVAAIVAALLS